MKKEHVVAINKELCVKCGLCEEDCPAGVIVMKTDGAEVVSQKCIKCGHCLAICPQQAVTISGFEDPSEEINSDFRIDAKQFLFQLKARRSMRQFTAQEVPAELINQIIEAGRYTPSGSNKQRVSYVILKDNIVDYEQRGIQLMRRYKKFLDLVSKRYKKLNIDNHFLFKGAPIAIVIKSTDVVDGALAAASMETMAQSLGLGVLYSGFFTKMIELSRKIRKKLGFTGKEKAVTTLVLGYPAVHYQRTAPKERVDVKWD